MTVENLTGYYEYGIQSKEYDYGDYFEDIVYPVEIIDTADNSHLIRGMKEYYKEKNIHKPNSKARNVIRETERKLNRKSGGATKHFDEITEAVNKGYIWKFKLDIPWHPRVFNNENRVYTFPHQHEKAILYTGQPKHVFFHHEGKKSLIRHYDNPRNPDSILEQGRIYPGIQHVETDEDGEPVDYEGKRHESGVWLGLLDKARAFPASDEGIPQVYQGSTVFEVEIPTSSLVAKNVGTTTRERIENLKDFKRVWKSPLKYAKDLDRQNEFIIPVEHEGLNLKYIVGVWDKGKFDYPHFFSFPKYVNLMRKEFPDRMPNKSKNNSIGNNEKHKQQKMAKKILNDNEIYHLISRMAETQIDEKSIINNSKGFNQYESTNFMHSTLRHKKSKPYWFAFTLAIFFEDIVKWNKLYIECQEILNKNVNWLSFKKTVDEPNKTLKMFKTPEKSNQLKIKIIREITEKEMSKEKVEKFINTKLEKEVLVNLNAIHITKEEIIKLIKSRIFSRAEISSREKDQIINLTQKLFNNELKGEEGPIEIDYRWLSP